MDIAQERLDRIRHLTEFVIPFRETIKSERILDAINGANAIMNYIYKDADVAIMIVDVDAGFLHQAHFHQEEEIICLLQGEACRIYTDHQEDLIQYVPIVLAPLEEHTMYYSKKSKVLAITIPASRHFPNKPE